MDITVLVAQFNPDIQKVIYTFNSIINQKDIEFEIVICDDGSTKDCFEDIEKYFTEKKFYNYKLVKLEENRGTVINILNGVSNASGKYIKVISPGDFLYNNHILREIFDYVNKRDAKIAFGDVVPFSYKDKQILQYSNTKPYNIKVFDKQPYNLSKVQTSILLCWNGIVGAGIVYEKEYMLRLLHMLDGRVIYAEDFMTYIAAADNHNIYHMNKNVVWYEYGGGISTSKNRKWELLIDKDRENLYEILYKNYLDNKVVMKSKKLKEISGKGGLIKFFWLLLKCPSKYYYFIYEIIWSKRKHYVEAEYNYLTEIMGIDRKEVSIRKV